MNSEERFKYFLKKLIGSKEFPFTESNWEKMKAMLPDNEVNGEEQFKDSLIKLVEAKEFSFEESHWEKMKVVLPEREKKNRLAPILWTLAGLLIVSGFGFYFFQTSEQNNSTMAANDKKEMPQEKTKNVSESPERKIAAKNIQLQQTQKQQEPKQIAIKNADENITYEKVKSVKEKHENVAETHITATKIEMVKEEIKISQIPANLTVKDENKKEKTTQQENSSEESEEQNLVSSSEHLITDIAAANIMASDTISPQGKNSLIIHETKQNEPIKQEVINEPTKENVIAKAANEENIVTQISDSTLAIKKDTSAVSPTTETANTNAVANIETPKTKKPFMYFEAGANYLIGWKNAGKREGNGFNPVVGFNYYNYLSEKFAISLGAQYMSISNLNYYSNTSKKITRYSFGEESEVTVITPQKMHYFIVPIKLNYFIDSNNTFGAGFNVGYLLTVDSKVETYTMHLNSKQNNKTYTASGYTEGFRTFDSQFSVFYRRRPYKNLGINAELFLGLSDIKNDVFFNSNVKERNRGLKLTLTYTILK